MAFDRCWCGGQIFTDMFLDPPADRCVDSPFHDPTATGRPTVIRRLYVAGPMTGYPDCNYPEFIRVAEKLEAVGFEVVNPATVVTGEERHYVDFIREDLRAMLDCDAVATLENWWESTGARNEVQVAGILKMPVRSWLDWMARAEHELREKV